MSFNLLTRTFVRNCSRTFNQKEVVLARKRSKFSKDEPLPETLKHVKTLSNKEVSDFKAILPKLINDLTFEGHHKGVPNINESLAKSIEYNVTDGKLTRGFTVALTLKLLNKDKTLSEEQMNESFVLGWCVELLQGFFLVADDIMDDSTTRRGKPCWWRRKDVGMIGFNDAILLETCIYTLLDKYFRDKPYYTHLLDAFLYTTRHTAMGQSLDLSAASCSLEDFTMQRYIQTVQYKTSYYSFYLPVQLGMILHGITQPELYRKSRQILLDMGNLFQVQDDYLDCFGNPEMTGKFGTDIQDYKCSWFIVKALEKADSYQKSELKVTYGSRDPEVVDRIKSIYVDLDLIEDYHQYEKDVCEDLLKQIKLLPNDQGLNPDVFLSLLGKIYQRDR